MHEIEQETAQRKLAAQAQRKVSRAKREFRESMDQAVTGREQPAPAARQLAIGDTIRLKGIRQTGKLSRFLGQDFIEVEAGLL